MKEVNKVKTLSVRVSPLLNERLERECESRGVRMTDLVRLALESYLRDSTKVTELSKKDLTAFYLAALKLELGTEG
jgi:predicted DNA-binding protein